MIKKILLPFFVILALAPSFIFAKTKTVSRVNDLEVRVESDQPGTVIVENQNGVVKIKTSQGITPTIYISDKKITPTIIEVAPEEKREIGKTEHYQERDRILEWIKTFFSSILNFLFR